MDLSKLPKMSQSPPPPPQPAEPATVASHPAIIPSYEPRDSLSPGMGGEVWVSAIIGIICLLIGRNFGVYLFTMLSGGTYHTGFEWQVGPNAGQEVPYPQLQGFVMLNDAAIFSFGVALVLEAILFALVFTSFKHKRPLVIVSLAMTVIAVAFNLFVAMKLLGAGVTPLFSLLVVAFGGYAAMYQWKIFRMVDLIGSRQLP